MRPDIDTYFLQMAKLASTRSTCLRRAVGCVLVNVFNHVLATGYNGVARGQPHCNVTRAEVDDAELLAQLYQHYGRGAAAARMIAEHPFACAGAEAASGTELHQCEAIHAEQNALLQCRDTQEILTAYVTTTPCIHCVKLLLNTSCRTIVAPWGEVYDTAALALWQRADRVVRFVA